MTILDNPVRYFLVGRVPVRMQERSDGVSLVAFNPLLGGFVSTARYYSAIKDEDAREIDEAEFDRQVEILKGSEFYVPATT